MLTLFILGTLINSEDPDEMPHKRSISSVSALFAKIKIIISDRKRSGSCGRDWGSKGC